MISKVKDSGNLNFKFETTKRAQNSFRSLKFNELAKSARDRTNTETTFTTSAISSAVPKSKKKKKKKYPA